MLTELCLIRHGAYVTGSADRAPDGRWDPPLSPDGAAQSRALAGRLAQHTWDALRCSHLARSRETARILGGACELDPIVDERWAEFYKGDDEIVGEAPWPVGYAERWRDGAWASWPGGESRTGFRERVLAAMSDIVKRHEGGRVIVVTHGGVINEVVTMFTGGQPCTLFRNDLTSVTRVGIDGDHCVVGAVNDVWHLEDSLTLPLGVFAYQEPV